MIMGSKKRFKNCAVMRTTSSSGSRPVLINIRMLKPRMHENMTVQAESGMTAVKEFKLNQFASNVHTMRAPVIGMTM